MAKKPLRQKQAVEVVPVVPPEELQKMLRCCHGCSCLLAHIIVCEKGITGARVHCEMVGSSKFAKYVEPPPEGVLQHLCARITGQGYGPSFEEILARSKARQGPLTPT